ncbi:hypothetical protein DM02DRAFT_660888 [Periconia macrospinosa]|uniref:Uncharacterized protein n=1 Tax=Periconia macrospinosa TaxID=97972 RepID=A0A2V1D985_9PLEO|nr:hypothetical protein DM02DRAFT_660888 [Periconia macrospinosa]
MSAPHSSSAASPLLSLPGEIRNRIYQLVLARNEPVHYVLKDDGELREPVEIPNPFRNVCKALRQETEALAVQLNTIQIEQRWTVLTGGDSIYKNFPALLQSIVGFPTEWMRRLVLVKHGHGKHIDPMYAEMRHELNSAIKICTNLPKLDMTYALKWSLLRNAHCFMSALEVGIFLTKLVHGEDIYHALVPGGRKDRTFYVEEEMPKTLQWPENLRVMPISHDISAEERNTLLRPRYGGVALILRYLRVPQTRRAVWEKYAEVWWKFVEEWKVNGIGIRSTENHTAIVAWAKEVFHDVNQD